MLSTASYRVETNKTKTQNKFFKKNAKKSPNVFLGTKAMQCMLIKVPVSRILFIHNAIGQKYSDYSKG